MNPSPFGNRARDWLIHLTPLDHQTCAGHYVVIDATQGFKCVGRYRSMEDALGGIGPTGPDVALVDIGLPACRASRGSSC